MQPTIQCIGRQTALREINLHTNPHIGTGIKIYMGNALEG